MKSLNELANDYAQSHFPITGDGYGPIVKHDIAFHSFVDGHKEATRTKQIIKDKEGGMVNIDKVCKWITNTFHDNYDTHYLISDFKRFMEE